MSREVIKTLKRALCSSNDTTIPKQIVFNVIKLLESEPASPTGEFRMNEIIEKLKDKNYVKPFGLMEETLPGSQEAYRKAGPKNLLQYVAVAIWAEVVGEHLYDNVTYAIKPNYPEPEGIINNQ